MKLTLALAAATLCAGPAWATANITYIDSSGIRRGAIGTVRADVAAQVSGVHEVAAYADLAQGKLGAKVITSGFGNLDMTTSFGDLLTFNIAGASSSTLTPVTRQGAARDRKEAA